MTTLHYKVIKIQDANRNIVPDNIHADRIFRDIEGLQEAANNEQPELVIYDFTEKPDFYNLNYLYEIKNTYRHTAELNTESGTNQPDRLKDTPVVLLILYKKSYLERKQMHRKFGIQYWDASIWQRWVAYDDFEEGKATLLRTIEEIRFFFKHNLYQLPATKEYCEFTTRLYNNSFIIDATEDGHAGYVVPFPFFQESLFQKKFRREIGNYNFLNIQWRILVIDDNAVTKQRFIEDWLYFNYPQSAGLFTFDIADNVPTGLRQISQHRYDIILLDYLIGDRTKNERQLSIEILTELNCQKDNPIYLRGPGGKFWIFPISSFSSAFIDHVREEGLELINDCWIIERGADPLNAPNSFLFNFISFLKFQLQEFKGSDKANIQTIWETALSSGAIHKNFTRNWANSTLSKILTYRSKTDSLKDIAHPDNKPSLFAQSFLKSAFYGHIMNEYKSGLYGYLIDLLFLLTFNDGYQWEEMKTSLDVIKEITSLVPESTNEGYSKLYERILELQKIHDQ